MSEENSTKAEKPAVKKTTAKKAAPRSKTSAAKPATARKAAVKKPAPKKAPAKKATPRTKPAVAKTAAAKTAAAASKPQQTERKTEKVTQPSQAQDKATSDDSSANNKHDTGYSSEPNNQTDAAQILDDLKGRDWPQIAKRAVLMFFFGVLGSFALYLSFVLAVAQVGFSIFAGQPNEALTNVMRQCALYIRDVLDYLSFASDECPFPFGRDLPESE